MKKAASLIVLFILPALLSGSNLRFQSPSFKEPFYRILFSFEAKQDSTLVKVLQVNSKEWENFSVFKEGKNVATSKPLAKGTYEFIIDYAWGNRKKYKITLSTHLENSQKITKTEIAGKSPKNGGIFTPEEGFYRAFKAEEPVGLKRKGEISYITFTVAKKELENKSFIVFDGNSQLEYQILDAIETIPPEKAAKDHPVTLTFKIAFSLDMSAYEKKILLILKGERLSSEKIGFAIAGEGIGKTIIGKRVSLEFHPKSGQVNIIKYLKEGIKLYNEAGVIHWNPGCHIPGIAWDHSFNWNPPPSFEEKIGKFLYINSRRGPLQKIKDVNLEVKYILEANSPYFISETKMSVKKPLAVSAIRNDEMVLYKDLFDTLIYKNKRNITKKMLLKEKAGYPDGFVHAAPDDVEWVGLLNTKRKYGFFSLRINYVNSNLNASGTWLNKPGTFFYAPSNGKYVYWVRPLLYTWADYTTRNLLTFVPEGSSFYEKNAYILLPLKEGYEDNLNILIKKLRSPVRIF